MEHTNVFFEKPQNYLRNRVGIEVRMQIARELLGNFQSNSILDIGCGDASISRQFLSSTTHLTLLDLSDAMLDVARAQTPSEFLSRVLFINHDFLTYTFDQTFDVIFCF